MSTTVTETIDFGEIAKIYSFHEELYDLIKYEMTMDLKSWTELSLQDSRAQLERFYKVNGRGEFDGTVKEMFVPSPDVEGGIPVSVYTPTTKPSKPTIVVYLHGGGLLMSTRQIHDASVKLISSISGAVVVSVEYRLLPNPDELAPFKDCETVARWVLANKMAVGGVAESKVGVAGDSAGGLLACNVGLDVPGFDFEILIFPMVDVDLTVKSCKEFQSTLGIFNTDALQWIFDHLKPHNNTVLYVPGTRPDVSRSPPTLILQAQVDPLRDWGLNYAEKLRAAGVQVQVEVAEGVPHGFLSLPTIFKTTARRAATTIADFINKF